MKKQIAVVGSGIVGETLANGFLKHGYTVMRATREPAKLSKWKQEKGSQASVGTPGDAVGFGDMLVLAVKGTAAEPAVDQLGPQRLAGKIVIDTTNPIADLPPSNGVLRYFTNLDESLMERLQRKAPQARFVKAFSCVGNALMVDPKIGGTRPTMFICGNDADAKREVSSILDDFGWEVEDMGTVEAARAIEPLCMLWCIPGLTRNRWTHAFKLLT